MASLLLDQQEKLPPAPLPKDLRKLPPPSEKVVVDVADSASTPTLQGPDVLCSEDLLDTKSLEESTTAIPTALPHDIIDGSSCIFSSNREKFLADSAESTSALTLEGQDYLDSSLEESITASPQTVPHNTIDSSSGTLSSIYETLLIDVADSASALTLQEPDVSYSEESRNTTPLEELIAAAPLTVPLNTTEGSPLSASHLGSKILVQRPPNTNQVYFIRMDHSGSFCIYPCLGGPFHSLTEAEAAINNHLDELRRPPMFQEQDRFSHDQFSDAIDEEYYLVQALLDQYNDGHCHGCINNGSPDMQHPNDTGAYTGGHLDGYLPFGDDELSDYDEDEEAEEARLRIMFKGLDDPCVLERIYRLATEPV
ncbi:hypothetical protein QOZ80_6BG0459870 [Eleusine coracana subsp. coracana]|nr:hypothetical protein QOZ80_6BG0459870 [Eleusine coracana subsp. coracana]